MATTPQQVERYSYVLGAGYQLGTTIATASVAIQLFMVLYGLSVFLETPQSLKKGRLPYVAISFLILVMSGIPMGIDTFGFFDCLYRVGGGRPFLRCIVETQYLWYNVCSTVLTQLLIILGDGILFYRCFIIWADKKIVLVLPGLLYLASIAITLWKFITVIGNTVEDPFWHERMTGTAFLMLTVALNVANTSLIAYRLLHSYRHISSALPGRSMKPYERALSILIESAVPLTITGLGYAINEAVRLTIVPASAGSTTGRQTEILTKIVGVASVFSPLYTAFAALSPQMIIFRVTTGRSWMRHEETTAPIQSTPEGLRFDKGSSASYLDEEELPGAAGTGDKSEN
ncbi:hypothetical protein CC1G_10498 [Coprinopsis cinerea okayama7|uniref:Pheromone receptor n=1 Tax=Coprinopsis cinerea (strain Okayama-7 / 130 / ATCC MYA-4618 / FGSC 9003) TaxID=240176 RepID=A8NL65_COPC7|nr:hypothetical protein CC1G_10498 [Coprinopsis cinerea okayama7\|eukprot:XP_001834624.1 hypothetical protein CC1G_10498 [Coprinopsis cinerea okayama7\